MKKKTYPRPWNVYVGKLRPKPLDKSIVEVIDRDGNWVLPWQAFDHLDSLAAKKRLAKIIVAGVNGTPEEMPR